ncbi:CysS3 [Desulfamplus magnetovallimortis]|uniref:Cysteine--tRNA ligase n=1 Tax=Desulfamplus magnetovallimortis TaxID=1246637 RepID=A0A1W1HLS7_9BACT|nr:cysteine synthase [Desulfamplus magnetovallimortis]SLM33278.1 CysS3 [Desulfamplus magnetovallimortis]
MSYSILDAIGNTPLVEIKRINPVPGVRILAKLEYFNPGGSIKDRAALSMIEQAEKKGELTKEKIVVEATSGNTGIGLAMICSIKGYKLLLTMSESASEERKRILKARGAQILLTPGHKGSDGAIEEAYRLGRENPEKYFLTDQYNNEANWQAHYHTTAVELWEQTHGNIDTVVATLGTSGTLMGLSRRLKEFKPDIKIVGAEPFLGHAIQGLKNMKESYRPDIFDKKRLDEKVNIEDEEAFETARRMAREEGLFVGMSSGAAMAVAIREARKLKSGTIVVILPDSGERYLTTSLFTVKDNIQLYLYNSVEKKNVLFEPLEQGKVSVYTCGPTVDASLHVGQYRRFVCADLLCRYLEYRKLTVNHVVNITDLDDRTIQGSEKAGISLSDFTDGFLERFKSELTLLSIREAQAYPRVRDHLDGMVRLAGNLADKGFAYEKLNSLYFDLSSLHSYGALSGLDLDKIKVGATVDLDDYEKDNPRDFTLLKRVGLSELKRGLCVNTPWGNVRPSLHLQCATLSTTYLGEQFDIHTGSRELLFPHHENEVAISVAATGKSPARYWMHCDSVQYDGSLGKNTVCGGDSETEVKSVSEVESQPEPSLESLTLPVLMEMGWSPRAIRFMLLSAHYRKPLILSQRALSDAVRSLEKLDRCVHSLMCIVSSENGTSHKSSMLDSAESDTSHKGSIFDSAESDTSHKNSMLDSAELPDMDQLLYDIKHGFLVAMDDDFKISSVFAVLFKGIRAVNRLMDEGNLKKTDAESILQLLKELDNVLKIFDFNPEKRVSPEIQKLLDAREIARKNTNWEEADKIREKLIAMGVEIHDKKYKK